MYVFFASTITLLMCLQEQLDSLRLQLEERHQQELEQLRSSMALTYKEELLQARTELTDRYYKDIDQLNTKHAHELEQLRAKLSDNHIKGKALSMLQALRFQFFQKKIFEHPSKQFNCKIYLKNI